MTQDSMKLYDEDKQKSDLLSEEITNLKMRLAAYEKDLTNINENILRIEKYIGEICLEKDQKRNAIEEIKLSKTSLEQYYTITEETIRQKNQEKMILEAEIADNIQTKEYISKQLEECLLRKEEIDKSIHDLQMKKHDMDIKITKSETQVDSLKDKLWDEFEISYIQAIEIQKTDFKYTSEAKDAKELAFLMEQRSREHALNVVKMLFKPEQMIKEAGTGQRQGFEDVGPARV